MRSDENAARFACMPPREAPEPRIFALRQAVGAACKRQQASTINDLDNAARGADQALTLE
jgi:hypothetical protein